MIYDGKYAGGPKITPDDILHLIEELNRDAAAIQLQLNPFGEIDGNILRIVDAIVVRGSTPMSLIDLADKQLVAHSQWLLKVEWEKVKYEARPFWYRAINSDWEERRLRTYRRWAADEGSLQDLIKKFEAEKTR